MLTLITTSQFRKDLKKLKKRGANLKKLELVLEQLLAGQVLDNKYRDHALIGNYKGFRECHIEPDWLLIYAVNQDKLILTATRTGTHSDLF